MVKKQIENKALTVSEIAEKAGVSRNVVWSYIRKNKIKPILKEKKNFKFDSEIVLKIKEKQKKKQQKNNEKEGNGIVSDTVLEILQKQLEEKDNQLARKDKQLDKKDEQLKSLNDTIDFLKGEVLQVRLENQKTRKLLEEKQKKEDALTAEDLAKDEKKTSFWSKLFK